MREGLEYLLVHGDNEIFVVMLLLSLLGVTAFSIWRTHKYVKENRDLKTSIIELEYINQNNYQKYKTLLLTLSEIAHTEITDKDRVELLDDLIEISKTKDL